MRINSKGGLDINKYVSIHASVMDAKAILICIEANTPFQSTHPWWMRIWTNQHLCHIWCFNPRIRDGCEFETITDLGSGMFQSTHPWWMRTAIAIFLMLEVLFQSTHPWWMRITAMILMRLISCFNPRIRDGCENIINKGSSSKTVSIHASVMDAKQKTSYKGIHL